jgi:hypothetical protein
MRALFSAISALLIIVLTDSCQSSSTAAPAVFCDTTCNNDTIRFMADNPAKSFVTISMKNCMPDSVTWGNNKMTHYRQLDFADLLGKSLHINKNYVKAYINEDSYVWLLLNECINGQGYIVKMPFNDKENIFRKNSALNSLDPKYNMDETMVAYTDKGNLFVEQMTTGKKAMMTFGEPLEMEYYNLHQGIDSVSVTPTHIWARIKTGKDWKVVEKDIVLE